MVNEQDIFDDETTVFEDEHHEEHNDIELTDEEATEANKLKQLRQKIAKLDEEKRQILEDSAREKADFLNARRRLEVERSQDKVRQTMKHIEKLLPLCDSFDMARSNKEAWEKADEQWRKGIEGIHTQLQQILTSYGITEIAADKMAFDPYKHEAIGTVPVDDKSLDGTVIATLQKGYEMNTGETVEVIRPARVTTGTYEG